MYDYKIYSAVISISRMILSYQEPRLLYFHYYENQAGHRVRSFHNTELMYSYHYTAERGKTSSMAN